jgi:hypothetical protein
MIQTLADSTRVNASASIPGLRVVVFLGPSLPLEEARRHLPDATFLPPARQADLMSTVGTYDPDVIALIDGEFGQSMSVWHKEVLFAISRGVHVYGASSMGALRAAEMDEFGMRGVGQIYEAFRRGDLTDDDEVAVAHARSDVGYQLVSEPMVNLRATIAAAREARELGEDEALTLTNLAKNRFYPERSRSQLVRDFAATTTDTTAVARVRAALDRHYRDVKADDARTLLDSIAALPAMLPRATANFQLAESTTYVALYDRDRTVRHQDTDVTLASIANYAALNTPEFHEINQHALNRALVGYLGELMHIEVSADDIADETGRFRLRHRLLTDEQLAGWLSRNDLFNDEFERLMRDAAVQRAMQRWLVVRQHLARTTKVILNELRHAGTYEAIADAAAGVERLLQDSSPTLDHIDHEHLPVERLLVEHMRKTGARIDTGAGAWALDTGFHTLEDLRIELLRLREARRLAHESALQALAGTQPGSRTSAVA